MLVIIAIMSIVLFLYGDGLLIYTHIEIFPVKDDSIEVYVRSLHGRILHVVVLYLMNFNMPGSEPCSQAVSLAGGGEP